ncbi:MAG: TonB C-terminal domain-containing protein [Syntrophales bacterium]|nr:TonB C-terminal domain-containing protein [Syntrophales bacterium]
MHLKRVSIHYPQKKASVFLLLSLFLHASLLGGAFFYIKPEAKIHGAEISSVLYLLPESEPRSASFKEEVVNLSSEAKDSDKYAAYLAHIKKRIEKRWRERTTTIPPDREERTAVIYFTIDVSGTLVASKLVSSSGKNIFDEASLKVVRESAPFAPIPLTYKLNRLHVIAHFHYTASP